MKLLLSSIEVFYLLMALRFFFAWSKFLQRDASLSSRQGQLYLRLVIITILWPIIVPFAYLELLSKVESKNDDEFITQGTDEVEVKETEDRGDLKIVSLKNQ